MKKHFLYPLFGKLCPNEARLDEQHAIQPFAEFITILYLSPLALVGMAWLMAASDLGVILQDPRGFAILLISLLIIQSRPASVPLRLSANRWTHMTISLGSILLWVGLFIWGETALVIDLMVTLMTQIWAAWQHSRYANGVGWTYLASTLQSISNTTLAGLVGMVVFRAMGGEPPLDGLRFVDWTPAFAALIVSAILPALIMLPVIIQMNKLSKAPNTWTSLGTFMVSVMRVLLITTPFAIPFTLLYTRATPAVNWFATIGLVLVNLLLYYLSRTNERSRQRTREMTQLEALGEEIIQAPPDGSTLRELLMVHVGLMFQDARDILEIRIFDGVELPGFVGGPESLHLVHPGHQSPCPESYWDELKKTDDPDLVIRDVIPAGAKAVYGDAIIDKITSAVAADNGDEQACIGGVYLLRHKSVAKSEEALPAVQALASQVASALYRAQVHAETLSAHKMAQELAFAGKIQASFLPDEVPAAEGWGIAASLTPARQTSGDFYDFIPLGEGKLGLVVADVADKGTGAALYMALSRTLIRTHAMQFPDDPAETLRRANERILADTRANQFVTVFYGVLNLATGELVYCSAGHNPAFIIRAADAQEHDSYIRTGAPLGIFGDLEWESVTAQIHPDDILLIYSDGVNEAQNQAEEFYGYERLLAVPKTNGTKAAAEVHDAMVDDLQSFVGSAPQFDDITLMILKREALEKEG